MENNGPQCPCITRFLSEQGGFKAWESSGFWHLKKGWKMVGDVKIGNLNPDLTQGTPDVSERVSIGTWLCQNSQLAKSWGD